MQSEGLKLVGIEPVTGSALAWAIFHGISSALGGIYAGLLNMSDYTRFAKRPNDPLISQTIVSPVVGVLTSMIGIVCASSASQFYPTETLLWIPYNLLTAMQTDLWRQLLDVSLLQVAVHFDFCVGVKFLSYLSSSASPVRLGIFNRGKEGSNSTTKQLNTRRHPGLL